MTTPKAVALRVALVLVGIAAVGVGLVFGARMGDQQLPAEATATLILADNQHPDTWSVAQSLATTGDLLVRSAEDEAYADRLSMARCSLALATQGNQWVAVVGAPVISLSCGGRTETAADAAVESTAADLRQKFDGWQQSAGVVAGDRIQLLKVETSTALSSSEYAREGYAAILIITVSVGIILARAPWLGGKAHQKSPKRPGGVLSRDSGSRI